MGGLRTRVCGCASSRYRLRIVCALPPTYSPLLERRVYYRNVFHQERERERERAGLSRVYPRHRAREAMHMDMPATVSGQRQGAAWRAIGESEPMRTLAAPPRPPRVGDHTRVSDPSSSSSCSTEPQQQSPPERHERARVNVSSISSSSSDRCRLGRRRRGSRPLLGGRPHHPPLDLLRQQLVLLVAVA